mmetsp:Transcript_24359/g.34063  ORF Transcript_24359/g.34063 Transcript_24359/m.34063 type:complete len:402 (-) Transcript_24359:842-2047(-)|eukprot:CAMPEP_0185260412 /NCGR_PEP_ID=MMETSP1359-20130426/9011_1 /TAXON_ID=552665 /ORGANISM="Bigelowiella longifila, Strain CCMP242" /LENGTH=401 /DNA_ID=CAMNT_0027846655 /DNA_START=17 /DNA_END=1222 /DNA_ORIENTATION=+
MTLPDRCRSDSTGLKGGESNSQSLSLPTFDEGPIELAPYPELRSFFPHVRRNPQRAARCNNQTLFRDCLASEDDEEDGDNDTNTSPISRSTDDGKLMMELEDNLCIAAEAFIGSLLDAFEESSMLADSSGNTDNDREACAPDLRRLEDNGSVASGTSSTSDKSWRETEKIVTAATVKKKKKKKCRHTIAPENPIDPAFPEVPILQKIPRPPPNTPRSCTSKIPKYLQHRRRKLPRKAREILSAWFESNIADPYPSDDEREELIRTTGLTSKQIHHWFTNRRKRDVKWRAKYLFRGRGRRPKNAGKLARAMAAAMAAQQKHNDHQVRQQQMNHSFANISKGLGSCNTSRRRSAAAAFQSTAFKEEQGGRGQELTRLLKRRRSCDNAVVLSLTNFLPKPEKSF